MHTRLTIPEQLKDLRIVEKRMSLGNLLTLAEFYHISTDYLLCQTELREHTNKSVFDLHLNDDAVQILTDEKYNPRLLSEFRKIGRSTPFLYFFV